MKPRHIAALALVGWYLMVPTVTSSHDRPAKINSDKPIAQWTVWQSFDSAELCERARADMKFKLQGKGMLSARDLSFLHFSQCIATDDPRLKEE